MNNGTRKTLVIHELNRETDEGEYSCKVTNGVMSTVETIPVKVVGKRIDRDCVDVH